MSTDDSTSSATNINYAKISGFNSEAAAIVFTILYVPIALFFILISIRKRVRDYIILVVFCLIRTGAFATRAAMIGSEAAGENKGLFIANQVLFGTGYLGLLNSTYFLVIDRLTVHPEPLPGGRIAEIARNRRLFRIAVLAATVLSIVAINELSEGNAGGESLRKVSAIIFLVMTALEGYLTLTLLAVESSEGPPPGPKIGAKHGAKIFALISVFLLVREIFTVATLGNPKVSENEHFFYPLLVVPEILVVLFFMTPGLVPSKEQRELAQAKPAYELPRHTVQPGY